MKRKLKKKKPAQQAFSLKLVLWLSDTPTVLEGSISIS